MITTRILLVFIICGSLLPVAQVTAKIQDELVMGIFPRRNALKTNHMFRPLASFLSEKMGVKVVLHIPKNFDAFWKSIQNREYDIVHMNQYHYVKAHKIFNYDVIVKNVEFGEATISGSLVIRKDSGIKKVSDLKNRVIVFGGNKSAMQSYIIARHLLKINGLKHGDYTEAFATNPPNAIMSTYFQQSAAAGAGDKVLKLPVVSDKIDITEMMFLVRGEQLSHLPWAIKKELHPDVKISIQTILETLQENKDGIKLLKMMDLDKLVKAVDEDYNQHRKIIKSVLDEQY